MVVFALLVGAAVVLGMSVLVGFHLLLLALLWESEYKAHVFGVVVVLETGACAWLLLHIRSRMASWSPFEATREQCEKDAAWVEQLLNRKPPE